MQSMQKVSLFLRLYGRAFFVKSCMNTYPQSHAARKLKETPENRKQNN